MEQYIKKSDLAAEIERRIKELQDLFKEDEKKLDSFQKTAIHLCIDECKVVLNILDTLEPKVDLEDVVEDAKDLAMRDIAWKVHVMISEGKSIREIDHYVCGICDF